MNDRRREPGDRPAIEVVREYLALRGEADALAERIDALKMEVLDIVTDEPDGKLLGVLGCDLVTTMRKTWSYSAETTQRQQVLDAIKKVQRTGEAHVEKTSVVLTVRAAKPQGQ